jgi:hypothetical protein
MFLRERVRRLKRISTNSDKLRANESLASLLAQAHAETIVRKGAQVGIIGAVLNHRIESKTDHGTLISVIDAESRNISHVWQ